MGAVCCGSTAIDFTEEVRLAHFDLLRCVGKGAFGKVRIVQHKGDKKNYALKYINKEKCVKMKAIDNIIQERRILEEIKFPLVCNLRYAFQDDENMFMVLDLMLGGDLRFHIDRKGALPEHVVRFFAAEVIVGLHYLHSKRFVHRDIKPDNVLLDNDGHAHLTDFNIAVRIKPGKKLTSVAGSLAYMAPEILQRIGYTFSVDWWSLGVLMYEMVFGQRPFRAKSNDELARLILQKPLVFPERSIVDTPVSDDCKDVIRGLCERSTHKRLGFGSSNYKKLTNHRWFQGVDWNLVAQKRTTPVYVPDSKHSNFDATHELEELLMEDTPLRVNNRAKNPKPLTREMERIELEFLNYDHTRTGLSPTQEAFTDIDPVARRTSSCSTKINTPPTLTGADQVSAGPSTPNRSQERLDRPIPIAPTPPAPIYNPNRQSQIQGRPVPLPTDRDDPLGALAHPRVSALSMSPRQSVTVPKRASNLLAASPKLMTEPPSTNSPDAKGSPSKEIPRPLDLQDPSFLTADEPESDCPHHLDAVPAVSPFLLDSLTKPQYGEKPSHLSSHGAVGANDGRYLI
ncbi:hypothetical protein H4R34_000964 [Dimargaris verticillata]|uniref:cAMP-dependent protein kinase n=1 Tax=Dimargaris verticillata TaxID=2761393 RepID=A0A9W8BCB7_9FUNG|nr:hypothetical protein H4R34_000964 [Dimargaris verticillata]